jgi:acetyltransferase-like isoleucine patch superfamily enzyme
MDDTCSLYTYTIGSECSKFSDIEIAKRRIDYINSTENDELKNDLIRASIKKCGKHLNIGSDFHFYLGRNINIGNNFLSMDHLKLMDFKTIQIGDNCFFGTNVQIITSVLEYVSDVKKFADVYIAPIFIGDNVVISENVKILPGVRLGNNIRILPNSIVNDSFPSNVTLGGIPAKIINLK